MHVAVSGTKRSVKSTRTRTMHQCLRSREILQIIVQNIPTGQVYNSFLDTTPGSEANHVGLATLASMAQTCRAFTEPAVDKLWRELPGVEPLILLLPANSWTFQSFTNGRNEFVLTRALLPEDWKRVNYYGPRVVSLSWRDGRSSFDLPVETFRQIALYRRTATLLPNLRALEWCSQAPNLPYIHLFLNPTVTELNFIISNDWYEGILDEVLPTIPPLCPRLLSFKFYTSSVICLPIPIPTSSPIIWALESLRTLYVRTAIESSDTLLQWSAMPSLQTLRLDCSPISVPLPPLNTPCFSSLRRLELLNIQFDASLLEFFRFIHPENLTHLEIQTNSRLGAQDVLELYDEVSRFITLDTLIINIFSEHILPAYLASILHLPLLRTFHLVNPHQELDDEAISDIANAFPSLRNLRLKFCKYHSVTIGGLLPLARRCKHLERLALNHLRNAAQLYAFSSSAFQLQTRSSARLRRAGR
ncbi:hypothetical protein HGRIS_006249 [Hohenbuehelia grisea]|uniref:F-box domain-containing protein n=1 Tax=Hohenbuehelia grisea TaxID=104357 RepID=A0ABR3K0H7_9AGAR